MSSQQDILIRAFVLLKSLQKNIGNIKESIVSETYINEYHAVLEKLKSIDIDTEDFYIPSSVIKIYRDYSGEKDVERTYFLTKIDAVLGYFEILTSSEPKKIGFRKSED